MPPDAGAAGLERLELLDEAVVDMPEPEQEYTIDELAALSRVPSRTIRFYQSAGALPRPVIRGRVAYYGPAHLERLKLVADLQDRGLRMKAISDLLGKVEKGELDLNEWLGLEAQLGAPWAEDRVKVVAEGELDAMIGGRRPGVLAELLRLRLVERQGEAFVVRSPGLLQIAMRLEAAGVDLEMAARTIHIIRKHAARAAADLGDFFFKSAREGFGREAGPQDMQKVFETLRSTSLEAVRLLFSQEMASVLRAHVESGKATKISRRKVRRRG